MINSGRSVVCGDWKILSGYLVRFPMSWWFFHASLLWWSLVVSHWSFMRCSGCRWCACVVIDCNLVSSGVFCCLVVANGSVRGSKPICGG